MKRLFPSDSDCVTNSSQHNVKKTKTTSVESPVGSSEEHAKQMAMVTKFNTVISRHVSLNSDNHSEISSAEKDDTFSRLKQVNGIELNCGLPHDQGVPDNYN